jgi:hypothetical protein
MPRRGAPALVVLVGAVLVSFPGCTATVLHDHVLGPERRWTIEWTEAAPWYAVPGALVGGVVCDGALGAASVALWPADWLGTAGLVGWQVWREDCGGSAWAAPVLAVVAVAALPVAPILEAQHLGPAWDWFPPKSAPELSPVSPEPPRPRPEAASPDPSGAR